MYPIFWRWTTYSCWIRSSRIYLLDNGQGEILHDGSQRLNDHYRVTAVFKGHSASIRHIDFSEDGNWLRSNCAGREILYWNAETGKQDRDALGKRDIVWGMTTCVFSWSTQGFGVQPLRRR